MHQCPCVLESGVEHRLSARECKRNRQLPTTHSLVTGQLVFLADVDEDCSRRHLVLFWGGVGGSEERKKNQLLPTASRRRQATKRGKQKELSACRRSSNMHRRRKRPKSTGRNTATSELGRHSVTRVKAQFPRHPRAAQVQQTVEKPTLLLAFAAEESRKSGFHRLMHDSGEIKRLHDVHRRTHKDGLWKVSVLGNHPIAGQEALTDLQNSGKIKLLFAGNEE
ncbi:unnamed protein product [Protopolystoma xenopodis]|uniref:Uncharacterized protein n=1 Tax=Protopolystoma xenopodis TaxID=117903 RepID=A0A448WWT1_9PLAT|nr:unnamed protein product [Protopolystoma xenopodis]